MLNLVLPEPHWSANNCKVCWGHMDLQIQGTIDNLLCFVLFYVFSKPLLPTVKSYNQKFIQIHPHLTCTYTPLHDYGIKRGPCFLPSNRGHLSLVFSGWGQNVWFLCRIAFLHVNMTHHCAMVDMVSQREERTYLSNAFLHYCKIIADIRWPRTVLNWGYVHGVKVKIHVCVLVW